MWTKCRNLLLPFFTFLEFKLIFYSFFFFAEHTPSTNKYIYYSFSMNKTYSMSEYLKTYWCDRKWFVLCIITPYHHLRRSATHRCHNLARLSDLHVIRNVSSIHSSSRCTNCREKSITPFKIHSSEGKQTEKIMNDIVVMFTQQYQLTCSIHLVSKVIEQLEVVSTLQAPSCYDNNVLVLCWYYWGQIDDFAG